MSRLSTDAAHLTPAEAAAILGVSPKTVNRWANAGRLPCAHTLGGHRRFRAEVIRSLATALGLDDAREADESEEADNPS